MTAHSAALCDGQPWSAHGGSFVGHLLPGIFLAAWALHSFLSATWAALTGRRQQPRGAAHHGLLGLPSPLRELAEPVLLILFPAVAILLEFKLSGTRSLRCPPGTAKAGELDVAHANSWSHASAYPPLMLSGAVGLVHTAWAPLPHGVPHFFLGAAFGTHAFLMLAHAKADPLDALLHRLLGACQAAAAGVALLQAARAPDCGFGLDAARSLAVLVQAAWFLVIAHLMFTPDPLWAARFPGDHTRVMFAPVLAVWVFLACLASLALVFVCMRAALGRLGLLQQQQQQQQQQQSAVRTGSGGGKAHGGGGWRGRYARLQQRQADDAGSGADDTAIELV